MSPQALRFRAKMIELALRVMQRDGDDKALDAARQRDDPRDGA